MIFRLRAPRQDRTIVAEPPLTDVANLLATNRQRLLPTAAPLLGQDWIRLRRQARQAAVAAAREYLREAGEPVPSWADASLLLAGHQPELFHPGVWVKNFALSGLARAHGLTPLNLVVDNDTAKVNALKVPVLDTEHPTTIPFDTWTGEVPYEERTVQDEALFATFPERVAPLVQNWGFVPLLPVYWAEVQRQAERTDLLGQRLAAARRSLERQWGCHNLEVPVSSLCRTEPFAWFACHLLGHLPRFHAVYNACVQEYRRRYGIRSRSHPVPDLASDGSWHEVPLWAWRTGQTQRGRLLARRTETTMELRVGTESWPSLPLNAENDPSSSIQAWRDLERQGFKVRSRALTNTLFARLFLADLFIHGIGGGKYDELTDEIIRRFYGFEPPGYLVLSATLLLPLPSLPVRPQDQHRLARARRDLHYNPQRHLDPETLTKPEVRELSATKQAWMARQPADAPGRRQRFQTLRTLTERLRLHVAERARTVAEALTQVERQLQLNAVVERRDYAFCLYPEELLRPFCTQFLETALPPA